MSDDTHLEVDPAVLNTTDSDYASSGYDTSTQSLTSSINEYVFENGRRYHVYYGPNKNLLPTDEDEQERMDLHHEILHLLLEEDLHKAPLTSPQRILDIGTGTGIWAIDMADKYPMAEVIGTDLSPIQPNWIPPNCRFEVDDAELEWLYKPEFFDYIHARNIAQGISDWSKLLKECYRCLSPGGYVELGEIGCITRSDDGSMDEDNAMKKCFSLLGDAMTKIGRPFPVAGTLKTLLENAGFVDVHEIRYKQPYGPWPRDRRLKNVGAMVLLMTETGIGAYSMAAYTRILGMDHDVAAEIVEKAIIAAKNKNTHMHTDFFVAYGRKPELE